MLFEHIVAEYVTLQRRIDLRWKTLLFSEKLLFAGRSRAKRNIRRLRTSPLLRGSELSKKTYWDAAANGVHANSWHLTFPESEFRESWEQAG